MLIGYSRVSTQDQRDLFQQDSLHAAGCEKIFTDKISGTVSERPGLTKVKEHLRSGDTLVIWRLDRLARSLKDLIEWSSYLEKNGIGLKSLQENIDTTTSTGRLIFHIFGALAEFERNLIVDRTRAALESSRARGRFGGRPKSLNKDKRQLAVSLYNQKNLTVVKICEMMAITKPTLYKYIRSEQQKTL
jgi:DNA invertase Pin-like site-specific DNA recombinase